MINLCEILKGHERESFYSPIYGNVCIHSIEKNFIQFGPVNNRTIHLQLASNGGHISYPNSGECLIFPSKDQRDWNKWAEEQKPKVPKTWNELVKQPHPTIGLIQIFEGNEFFHPTPVEKSVLALLKIHELIEVGYGGNVTTDEGWRRYTIQYQPSYSGKEEDKIFIECTSLFNHIAFHTEEQAKEFLSYPENVQLVKDFYMV